MKRKIKTLLLVVALIISLCSCDALDRFIKKDSGMPDTDIESGKTNDSTSKNEDDKPIEEDVYTDKIDPNEELKVRAVVVAAYDGDTSLYEDVVIKNNSVFLDGGGYYFVSKDIESLNYSDSFSIEYNEYLTEYVNSKKEGDPFYYWLDACLNKIKMCKDLYYFYYSNSTIVSKLDGMKGANAIYRFGDDIFILNGISNGNYGFFIRRIYYGKIDPKLDFDPLFTDTIDLTGEINISAKSIFAPISEELNKTVEIKIKNGEIWDRSGEIFYGKIYSENFRNGTMFSSSYLKKYIDADELCLYFDHGYSYDEWLTRLYRYSDVYVSNMYVIDPQLGRSCIICRIGNEIYILASYVDRCSSFAVDNIYRASICPEQ